MLFLAPLAEAQKLEGEKVSFRLNNVPAPEVPPDEKGPVIEIIAPLEKRDDIYRSAIPELDLIGQVIDESMVSFVSVNAKMSEVNEKGIFTSALQLRPGVNQVKLMAMDELRNMSELSILIEYVPPIVTLADRISKESTYYALIIGIDKYRDDDLSDLTNPVKDALTLQEVLIEQYTFDEENIRFLKNASREDIIRGLDELTQLVTEEDNLLIFYAGHGWWDENADNGYWLPTDANSGVKTNWVRNSTVVDYLKEINSKNTLLIADACFGGSIFSTRSAFSDEEDAIEVLYDLPSRKAMTSGLLTEVPDRSAFTRYLVMRLKENKQTYLSSQDLFVSFRKAVINNSNAIPIYGEIKSVGDQGGDFIFVRKEE
jgi:hypothetical protein